VPSESDLCQRAPRLPALPSLITFQLITFQFHPLVVSLSDIGQERVFYELISTHLALKGLIKRWEKPASEKTKQMSLFVG